MAKVQLNRCRLALLGSLHSPLVFGTRDRDYNDVLQGEVRQMANGRLRVVSRPTSRLVLNITMVQVLDPYVLYMRDWRGKIVLFRDTRGRKIYGTFFDIKVRDYKDNIHHDVSFTLQQVTYDDFV